MLMTVLSVQLDDSAEGENLLCIVFIMKSSSNPHANSLPLHNQHVCTLTKVTQQEVGKTSQDQPTVTAPLRANSLSFHILHHRRDAH